VLAFATAQDRGADVDIHEVRTGATSPSLCPANDPHYPARGPSSDFASGSTLYEEFHPFGTTSYAANDSGIEVSAKRYRYIGKERDEETGLYHLGARYYSSWLARWTATDPTGLRDGTNRYAYARGNPTSIVDPSGTEGERSPIYQQRQRIHQAQKEFKEVREHVVDVEIERFHAALAGEDLHDIDVELQGLRGELHDAERRVKVEKAVLRVARDGDTFFDAAGMRGFTAAERQEIGQRGALLASTEELVASARQHVARAPTARERGEEIRAQKQEARLGVIAFSLTALGAIETIAAARLGLVAVEARLGTTATSGLGGGGGAAARGKSDGVVRAVRDDAYTASRHTAEGKQVVRDLTKGKEAHVFDEGVDLAALEAKVWSEGVSHGTVRGYQRFTYESPTPIGRRVQACKPDVPLSHGGDQRQG